MFIFSNEHSVRLSEIESFSVLPEDSKHGARIEMKTKSGGFFAFYYNISDNTVYGNTERGRQMIGELLRNHIATDEQLNFLPSERIKVTNEKETHKRTNSKLA